MFKESELSFQNYEALEVPAYCRFCAAKWLNIGVCIRLTEVSSECTGLFYSKFGKKILGLKLVST